MEDANDTSSSHTETSSEGQNDSTGLEDTKNLDKHDLLNDLKTKAIEVNSADEVRQAVKAVLFGKTPQIQSEETDLVSLATLETTTTSEEIQVSLSHEYKPESGDQLLVPKQDKTRKRRGRPQKAGPSKRVKMVTVKDFYVGKLSNVVPFPSFKRKRPHQTESDSDDSIYTPYVAPTHGLKGRKKRF